MMPLGELNKLWLTGFVGAHSQQDGGVNGNVHGFKFLSFVQLYALRALAVGFLGLCSFTERGDSADRGDGSRVRCRQNMRGLDLNELQPSSGARLDRDSGLAPTEVLRNQANQLRVGLAIHRQRLELRETLARLILAQLAYAGIRLDLDFDDHWLVWRFKDPTHCVSRDEPGEGFLRRVFDKSKPGLV